MYIAKKNRLSSCDEKYCLFFICDEKIFRRFQKCLLFSSQVNALRNHS